MHIAVIMSPFLVAPSYIPIHYKLCALPRSTTTKQPCCQLIHCAADRPSPALRRSTDYRRNSWSNDYIQSLTVNSPVSTIPSTSFYFFLIHFTSKSKLYLSKVEEKEQTARIMLLKERIREVICENKEAKEQLQLIDHLQQLGVAYHFNDDIKDALTSIHASLESIISLQPKDTGVHVAALLFRLLRDNSFSITEGTQHSSNNL